MRAVTKKSFLMLSQFFLLYGAISTLFAEENRHFIEVSHYPISLPSAVSVTVLDHEGKPLPEAEVTLSGYSGGTFTEVSPPLFSTTLSAHTNAEGKAVFKLSEEWFLGKITYADVTAKSAKYTLSCENRLFDARHIRSGEPIDVPEDVTVSFEGILFPIHVLDVFERPIAGARIRTDPSRNDEVKVATSDEQGIMYLGPLTRDRLENLPISIEIDHPEFLVERLLVEKKDLVLSGKTLTLHRGSEVHGQVVDLQGRPVVGAVVHAFGVKSVAESKAVTDAEGRYRLKRLSVSQQLFTVAKEGKRLHVQTLMQSELGKEVNVTLLEPLPIRIKAVTETGQPLQGVDLLVLDLHRFDEYTWDPTWQELFDGLYLNSIVNLQTDENGFWEWKDMPIKPDEEVSVYLWAIEPDPSPPRGKHYVFPKHTLKMRPREEPYLATAVLKDENESEMKPPFAAWKDSKKLKVRVFDETLNPIKGAFVEPCSGYGDHFGNFIRVEKPPTTDENGVVIFDFSRTDVGDIQDFWVQVSAPGYRTSRFFHTFGTGFHDHVRTSFKTLPDETEIILSPEGKLVGLMRDDNGRHLEGVRVEISKNQTDLRSAVSDKNGVWMIDATEFLLAENEHLLQLTAKKEGYLDTTAYLRAYMTVSMTEARTVSFHVVDENGEPLKNVSILPVMQEGFSQRERDPYRDWERLVQTDAKGRASVGFDKKYDKVVFLLEKMGRTSKWVQVDCSKEINEVHSTLTPARTLRFRFALEGEKTLPEILNVSARIIDPNCEKSLQKPVKWWHSISRDKDGVSVLENVPDCETVFCFSVRYESPTHNIAAKYELKITPPEDEQIIEIVKTRKPEVEEELDYFAPRFLTPYGAFRLL